MDNQLADRLSTFRNNATRLTQQLVWEQSNLVRLQGKISVLETEKIRLVKAVGLIDRAIGVISANGIGKIESVVSGGLQLIFKDHPHLRLLVEKKEGVRGNSYRLLVRDGDVIGQPLETFGGGIVNVTAFLLRVIMIKRFRLAKFLVVDESFNNVSAEYLPAVSQLMTTLCHKHGYTILAVTHQPILASAADNVFRVEANEGQPPQLRCLQKHELDEMLESGILRVWANANATVLT